METLAQWASIPVNLPASRINERDNEKASKTNTVFMQYPGIQFLTLWARCTFGILFPTFCHHSESSGTQAAALP